jgi:hypothetical protein
MDKELKKTMKDMSYRLKIFIKVKIIKKNQIETIELQSTITKI